VIAMINTVLVVIVPSTVLLAISINIAVFVGWMRKIQIKLKG